MADFAFELHEHLGEVHFTLELRCTRGAPVVPQLFNMRLKPFNVAHARLDLHRLPLHDVLHLLEQLLGVRSQLGESLVLLRTGCLWRRQQVLLLHLACEVCLICRQFALQRLTQFVKFKLELCVFILGFVGAKLRVLHPIAHQIKFRFDFLSQVPLQFIDLVSDGVRHRANGLPEDDTLAFNRFNFLIKQQGTLRMFWCDLGGTAAALLSLSLLELGFVRLKNAHCVMQLEDLLSQREAFLRSIVRCSCRLHVPRLRARGGPLLS